jgi:hypothetical protein
MTSGVGALGVSGIDLKLIADDRLGKARILSGGTYQKRGIDLTERYLLPKYPWETSHP